MAEANMTAPGDVGPAVGGALGSLGGPLVGAAGTILGGVIGNIFNKKRVDEQTAFQREAMMNGISWRVADAKKAGIHPIFALGANIPTPTPMVLGDQLGASLADASQNIGTAIARQDSAHDRAMKAMEAELMFQNMRKIKGEADGVQIANEAALKALNETAHKSGLGQQPETPENGQVPAVPGGSGMIDLKAMDQISAKEKASGVVAGRHPAFQLYDFNGRPFVGPYGAGESLPEVKESMSIWDWGALVNRNRRFFGDKWFKGWVLENNFGIRNPAAPTKEYWKKAQDLKNF